MASPPGKDGGDDRAPGHGERYVVDGCRRALEARGRLSAPREPEHRGEVRRNGGRVARRADAPEEGQARARGQRGVGRGRPRGRPRGPEEAAPHRQADLRQAGRRARLRRVLHRAEVRPRAQARPGGGGRRGAPRARVGARHLPGRFREPPRRGRWEGPRPQAAGRDAPALERPAVRRPHVAEVGRSCSLTTAVLEEWPGLGAPKQVEYLAGCLEAGRPGREASKRAAPLRRCAPPAPKTFDGHGWSAVPWPEGMGRESLPALMSDVGTGKTYMASALCAPACERRLEARFFTASSLVMRLSRARDDGKPGREAALIGRARLPVIDGLGFLPPAADGARPLFQAFADANKRRSAAIATNLEFSRWGSVFGDD